MYVHYKAGHLAVAGGVLEQPQAYLEAMKVIQCWVNDHGS